MIKINAALPREHHYNVLKDQIEHIEIDFSDTAGRRGTTVSSVTWSFSGEATVTNEALSSGVASADLTANYAGEEIGTVTATYANAETKITPVRIRVIDPDCIR